MMSYCTITSGATLRKLYRAGWGIFLTPHALRQNRPGYGWASSQDPPMRYAIDNGAWGAFVNGTEWDAREFVDLMESHGAGSDFVVVPDIVEGGSASLELSARWIPTVLSRAKLALVPVQDGMDPKVVRGLLGPRVGVFVGGSTEFKEGTLRHWAEMAREASSWCHVGRVNSVRRINLCTTAGVDSIDGTSVCRFSCNLPKLDGARRQMALVGVIDA